jgi:hypothetical protein
LKTDISISSNRFRITLLFFTGDDSDRNW